MTSIFTLWPCSRPFRTVLATALLWLGDLFEPGVVARIVVDECGLIDDASSDSAWAALPISLSTHFPRWLTTRLNAESILEAEARGRLDGRNVAAGARGQVRCTLYRSGVSVASRLGVKRGNEHNLKRRALRLGCRLGHTVIGSWCAAWRALRDGNAAHGRAICAGRPSSARSRCARSRRGSV